MSDDRAQNKPYYFWEEVKPLLKVYDYDQRNELYRAMCNNIWVKNGYEYICSWRYAGGIIATATDGEDYMTYYCNGDESHVSQEIAKDLNRLGWELSPTSDGYEDFRHERMKLEAEIE